MLLSSIRAAMGSGRGSGASGSGRPQQMRQVGRSSRAIGPSLSDGGHDRITLKLRTFIGELDNIAENQALVPILRADRPSVYERPTNQETIKDFLMSILSPPSDGVDGTLYYKTLSLREVFVATKILSQVVYSKTNEGQFDAFQGNREVFIPFSIAIQELAKRYDTLVDQLRQDSLESDGDQEAAAATSGQQSGEAQSTAQSQEGESAVNLLNRYIGDLMTDHDYSVFQFLKDAEELHNHFKRLTETQPGLFRGADDLGFPNTRFVDRLILEMGTLFQSEKICVDGQPKKALTPEQIQKLQQLYFYLKEDAFPLGTNVIRHLRRAKETVLSQFEEMFSALGISYEQGDLVASLGHRGVASSASSAVVGDLQQSATPVSERPTQLFRAFDSSPSRSSRDSRRSRHRSRSRSRSSHSRRPVQFQSGTLSGAQDGDDDFDSEFDAIKQGEKRRARVQRMVKLAESHEDSFHPAAVPYETDQGGPAPVVPDARLLELQYARFNPHSRRGAQPGSHSGKSEQRRFTAPRAGSESEGGTRSTASSTRRSSSRSHSHGSSAHSSRSDYGDALPPDGDGKAATSSGSSGDPDSQRLATVHESDSGQLRGFGTPLATVAHHRPAGRVPSVYTGEPLRAKDGSTDKESESRAADQPQPADPSLSSADTATVAGGDLLDPTAIDLRIVPGSDSSSQPAAPKPQGQPASRSTKRRPPTRLASLACLQPGADADATVLAGAPGAHEDGATVVLGDPQGPPQLGPQAQPKPNPQPQPQPQPQAQPQPQPAQPTQAAPSAKPSTQTSSPPPVDTVPSTIVRDWLMSGPSSGSGSDQVRAKFGPQGQVLQLPKWYILQSALENGPDFLGVQGDDANITGWINALFAPISGFINLSNLNDAHRVFMGFKTLKGHQTKQGLVSALLEKEQALKALLEEHLRVQFSSKSSQSRVSSSVITKMAQEMTEKLSQFMTLVGCVASQLYQYHLEKGTDETEIFSQLTNLYRGVHKLFKGSLPADCVDSLNFVYGIQEWSQAKVRLEAVLSQG